MKHPTEYTTQEMIAVADKLARLANDQPEHADTLTEARRLIYSLAGKIANVRAAVQ